jgi:endo-1,4-beta-D-glucanase Y
MERYFAKLILGAVALLGIGLAEGAGAYAYGTLPSGYSTTDCTNAYSTWATRHRTSGWCTNSLRVDNSGMSIGGTTVSEGMGYGMLMSAYLDSSSANLTQLYNLYTGCWDNDKLMNWSVTACGNNTANAATDADVDAAQALVEAAYRWPSEGWAVSATAQLNKIYQYEVDSCKGLMNGDTWGGCSSGGTQAFNPSYFCMGYFKNWDCFELAQGGSGTRWSAVREKCYALFNAETATASPAYALPPDWIRNTGLYGQSDGAGGYGYDACRTPWRVALDYLWNGDARALNLIDHWTANFAPGGAGAGGSATAAAAAAYIGDDYNYSSGARDGTNHENEFMGAIAVAAMGDAANASFCSALYTNLVGNDNKTYFSDSLKVLYLMVLTGQFTPACGGASSTATITPSPTSSRTPSPSATATPSRTFSPTSTLTGTPSRSATPSPTSSSSGTGTPTSTFTPGSTQTSTGTPTASATQTRTATGTASPTITPSATATGSPSQTGTITPGNTATASGTRTATGTATSTGTPSATATRTPSPAASPTATFTFTDVPPNSTLTDTPTGSPTFSATATATASPSATASGTSTQTATGSASPTPSPSLTVTASATPSPSASPSGTGTGTQTSTITPGNSPTQSRTATPTPTASASPSSTGTATATASGTQTRTATATLDPTAPAGSSATSSATPSFTPGSSTGVIQALPYPNPNPRQVYVKLLGPADTITVRIYSAALVECMSVVAPATADRAGWQPVDLPAGIGTLANGAWYAVVSAQRKGRTAPQTARIRLFIRR